MISLIYVSSATRLFNEEELLNLLQFSRSNNEQIEITGMLLYKGGNFMQVIEGPEEVVTTLYQKILRDPRHAGVMLLSKQPLKERQFPDWSMGFQNLDKLSPEEIPGYSTFLDEDFTSEVYRANPTRAYVVLLNFKKNMR
jgi:hypothetical protein